MEDAIRSTSILCQTIQPRMEKEKIPYLQLLMKSLFERR